MKALLRLWEIPDNGRYSIDAVVGMSIAHRTDGTSGPVLEPVIEDSSMLVENGMASFLIFSNRFMRNNINLALLMKSRAITKYGVSEERVIIPDNPYSPEIRNAFKEAEFALKVCRERGFKSLLVVANHLHMRRVLAAFRKLKKRNSMDIELYWLSTGRKGYGINASSQIRFDSPYFFLAYEIFIAMPASIVLGWWG